MWRFACIIQPDPSRRDRSVLMPAETTVETETLNHVYNVIPFNATDSGPCYQVMINTIPEADPNVKGPRGYQIGNQYLADEVKEVEGYIASIKAKWLQYSCTIMCDGWSSRLGSLLLILGVIVIDT